MAIRPTDLQNALIVSAQSQPLNQRAEEQPRLAQAAAQAQFVSQTDQRNERVGETGDARGNRVEVKEKPDQQEQGGRRKQRQRKPGDPFAEVVDEASGISDEPPHLIDYSA